MIIGLPDEPPLTRGSQIALDLVLSGGSYFTVRELLQIISLWSLGNLNSYFWDSTNWLDVSLIVLIFYYGILMATGSPGFGDESFRTGVAFTKGILWIAFISFLKSTLVDFAVFVGTCVK